MFLERLHRFVRHYNLTFAPRKKTGTALPLIAAAGEYSVQDALTSALTTTQAVEHLSNGDIIELLKVDYLKGQKCIVLLFHRASPKAADPMYRRKETGGYTVRTVDRKSDEDQSVSAHLIILQSPKANGGYDAILEEIPGISMSLVRPLIGKILHDYEYKFSDARGKEHSTYTTFKPQGVKSESITNAIKTGRFNYITLSRPAKAPFIDSEDLFQPVSEKMRIRVKKDIEAGEWMDKIGNLARKARLAGWEDFLIDIEMDDSRSRSIPIARGEEAKEILFVRSAEVTVKNPLPVCSINVQREFVINAIKSIDI